MPQPQNQQYETATERYNNPEARLELLRERLVFIQEIVDIAELPGFHKLVAHLRAIVNKKNRERNEINPNDYKSLMAHGKKALFYTGFVQGAEYVLNDMEAALRDKAYVEKQIKEIEDSLKPGQEKP